MGNETKRYADCQLHGCTNPVDENAPTDIDVLCTEHLAQYRGKVYACKTGPGTWHTDRFGTFDAAHPESGNGQ